MEAYSKHSVAHGRTDHRRWRLKDDDSRHTWHYLSDEKDAREWPQSDAEKYYLDLPLDFPPLPKAHSPLDAAHNGLEFFEKLQLPSGHWGCESGGPMIFSTGIVIAWFVTNAPIPTATCTELKNHIISSVDPIEGGWGLHTTGGSIVTGTVINYCVLRILGMEATDPVLIKARRFLKQHGGATHSSLWGKFWLAVLGVVDWDIVNPMPPELWLIPDWSPVHPAKLYAEMRSVFKPMSYLYSKRWTYQGNRDFILALREEVLLQPFDKINWANARNSIAPIDNKQPRSWVLNCVNWTYINIWQPYLRPNFLKRRAESWASQLIDMQDKNTDYTGIAATDAPMNTIICYYRDGPDSTSYKRHIERLQEYLWMTSNGMQINSTNGSQCWDTSFLVQAVYHCGLHTEARWRPMLLKAYHFLERHQIREDCESQDKCYRQSRKGGWAFSNKDQGFVVSDCLAEALRAVILLEKTANFPKIFDDQRLFDAVDCMLIYQNDTGGVSAFEARKCSEYLDRNLNPTEIFGRFLVECDYTECTSSCVTTLCLFRRYWPEYRKTDVNNFIRKAVSWLKTEQQPDGSWFGNWGVCFTYGTMFALECLASVGELYNTSDNTRRGCDFLITKQREDGGWSESFKGCETMEYHEDPKGSLVCQTAWALIGLIEAQYPDPKPLSRAAHFLMGRQQSNGEWLEESIAGSFHNFCTFSYPNYKFTFTIKALGLLATRYPHLQLPVAQV